MRIFFWGTPEFAAPSLRALLGEGHEVAGVVTQPDKPQGRLRKIIPPPVKQIALEESVPVFQPGSPKDPDFQEMLRAIAPDISIVVAYGHILPRTVIDLAPLGTLNVHASLLPALRGAAPIQAAIRDGLRETGISIMRVVEKLDAGPVILQSTTPIANDETYGELQLRLAELGALTLLEALALISVGAANERIQDDARATYAPKITREITRVDWTLGAENVGRVIRAYDPKPGAFSMLTGTEVKLFGAKIISANAADPGQVIAASDSLTVACGTGAIRITDVQPSGKSRMSAVEWIRGRGVKQGDRFE
jgi:methionyl-tRNA formyltransferase